MKLFFALMIFVGLVMIFMNWFARQSGTSPAAVEWLGNKGAAAVAIGIVGLVCLWLSPGHAQEHHPPAIHEKFYSTWTMPDAPKVSCCSNDDCSPAPSRFINNRWEAERNGIWIPIPPNKVEQNRDSPDGRSHLCGRPGPIGEFSVFCFLPAGSS